MGLWRYSSAVGVTALAGTVVIGAVTYAAKGGDFLTGLTGAVFGLVWGGLLTVPLGALWIAVFTGVFTLIGRSQWWSGALAGLLAGSAVGIVLFAFDTSSAFSVIGTPAEQSVARVEQQLTVVAPVLWSAVSAGVLIRLAPATSAVTT